MGLANPKEVKAAYDAYKKIRSAPDNQNTVRAFKRFLGVNENYSFIMDSDLGEEGAARLKMLVSPHAETLYKAWRIKNGGV